MLSSTPPSPAHSGAPIDALRQASVEYHPNEASFASEAQQAHQARQPSAEYKPYVPDFTMKVSEGEASVELGEEIGPSVSGRPSNKASASSPRPQRIEEGEETAASLTVTQAQVPQVTSIEELECFYYDLCNPYELNTPDPEAPALVTPPPMTPGEARDRRGSSNASDISGLSEFWQDTSASRASNTKTSKLHLELSSQRKRLEEFEALDASASLGLARNNFRKTVVVVEQDDES